MIITRPLLRLGLISSVVLRFSTTVCLLGLVGLFPPNPVALRSEKLAVGLAAPVRSFFQEDTPEPYPPDETGLTPTFPLPTATAGAATATPTASPSPTPSLIEPALTAPPFATQPPEPAAPLLEEATATPTYLPLPPVTFQVPPATLLARQRPAIAQEAPKGLSLGARLLRWLGRMSRFWPLCLLGLLWVGLAGWFVLAFGVIGRRS